MTTLDRLPPQAVEVERAVLGALLLDKRAIPIAMSLLGIEPDTRKKGLHPPLGAEHFYHRPHSKIYQAIMDIHRFEGEEIDQLVLSQRLQAMGQLDECGGVVYLAELASGVASAANIDAWCRILVEHSMARYGIETASDVMTRLYDRSGPPLDVLRSWGGQLLGTEGPGLDLGATPHEALEAEDERYRLASEQKGMIGWDTGLGSANFRLGGWVPTEMTTIAADTSVGKTVLVLHSARRVARQVPIGIITMEMTRGELFSVMVRQEAQLHGDRYRRGQLTADEEQRRQAARTALMGLPIRVFDKGRYPLAEIESIITRERDIRWWMIDHLHLIRLEKMDEEHIAEATRTFKGLGKEMDAHMCLLAQFGYRTRERKTRRPQINDIRGASSVEQDSNNVILIHRPGHFDELVQQVRRTEGERAVEELMRRATLIYAKTRLGPTGEDDIRWDPERAYFIDPEYERELEQEEIGF